VPYVPPKEVTHPQPFHLMTDDRHRQHEAQQRAKLEEQRRMVRSTRLARERGQGIRV
jgi:hypothetical protein